MLEIVLVSLGDVVNAHASGLLLHALIPPAARYDSCVRHVINKLYGNRCDYRMRNIVMAICKIPVNTMS